MPVHLEFTLDYLIQRSGDAIPRADLRLDVFESTIARLSRTWRPYASGAVTDDSVPGGWVRLRLDSAIQQN